jgi:hypothetical protein
VNGDDIGVLEPGRGRRFRLEAADLVFGGSRAGRIIFNATTRFRLICRALYTIPMPPRAISSNSS